MLSLSLPLTSSRILMQSITCHLDYFMLHLVNLLLRPIFRAGCRSSWQGEVAPGRCGTYKLSKSVISLDFFEPSFFSAWLQSCEIYKLSESVISSSSTTPISSLYPVTRHLSRAIVMSMEYWSGLWRWLIIVYLSQSCVRDHLEQNLDVRSQKWRINTRRNTFWSINNVVVVAFYPYQLKWCREA